MKEASPYPALLSVPSESSSFIAGDKDEGSSGGVKQPRPIPSTYVGRRVRAELGARSGSLEFCKLLRSEIRRM